MVRACFVGDETTGSWKIRAEQIAAMRPYWTCRGQITPADIMEHDIFCFVKRLELRQMHLLRRLGKIVVYDILDCWEQPADEAWANDLTRIVAFCEQHLRDLPADGVIFPNRTMYEDLGHWVANPTVIYHHYRPGLVPISVKERVMVVGYEGQEAYLGRWQWAMEQACRLHDLKFVVNPAECSDLDIGFAARGGRHATLVDCRYKSNVKLANFYGAAIPCIVHGLEMSYRETAADKVRFVYEPEQLADQLAELLPHATRLKIHESFLKAREQFGIERIADQYEKYFREMKDEG